RRTATQAARSRAAERRRARAWCRRRGRASIAGAELGLWLESDLAVALEHTGEGLVIRAHVKHREGKAPLLRPFDVVLQPVAAPKPEGGQRDVDPFAGRSCVVASAVESERVREIAVPLERLA